MINKITENIKTKHGTFCILSSDLYIGNSLKKYGEYSEIELSIMTQFIKSEDYIFDIGSNIGAFTIPFSKKVGKLGKLRNPGKLGKLGKPGKLGKLGKPRKSR